MQLLAMPEEKRLERLPAQPFWFSRRLLMLMYPHDQIWIFLNTLWPYCTLQYHRQSRSRCKQRLTIPLRKHLSPHYRGPLSSRVITARARAEGLTAATPDEKFALYDVDVMNC